MGLLDKIEDFILPEVKVDDERKTYEMVTEGMFFNNITELYYTLNCYYLFTFLFILFTSFCKKFNGFLRR